MTHSEDIFGYCTLEAFSCGIFPVHVRRQRFAPPDCKYVYTTDRAAVELVLGETFFTERSQAEAAVRKAAEKMLHDMRREYDRIAHIAVNPKWADSPHYGGYPPWPR